MNAKTLSILLLASACALPSLAKDKGGKGNGGGRGKPAGPAKVHLHTPGNHHNHNPGANVHVNVTFGASEKDTIRAYVANGKKGKGLPPGLAKKVAHGGDLPPGWQKKCVTGETLPAVVFKHCHPLPHELVVKLPPPPHDTVYIAIDGRVLHVHKTTHRVHAVFEID